MEEGQQSESSLKRLTDETSPGDEPPFKRQKIEGVDPLENVTEHKDIHKEEEKIDTNEGVPFYPEVKDTEKPTIAPIQEETKQKENATEQATAPEEEIEENQGQSFNGREPEDIINKNYLGRNNTGMRDEYRRKTPFSHCILQNFSTEEFAEELKDILESEEWYQKKSDLTSYEHTSDLKLSTLDPLQYLRHILYSDKFREFLFSITGIGLHANVEMVGHIYKQGGQLLCHAEEAEGRRIAFVYFLVPKDWSQEDGGTLDFFDRNDLTGQPTTVSVSIPPKWNTFVFFELGSTNYYQFSEILSDKELMTISGYFYGPPLPPSPVHTEPLLEKISVNHLPTQVSLQDWIRPDYLKRTTQRKLQVHFQKEFSLALSDFLLPEKYNAVEAELKNNNVLWHPQGPPNRRHYDTMGRRGEDLETGHIQHLKLLLRSKPFISFVEAITGLNVWEAYRGEIRRFKCRDYTLVRDTEEYNLLEGLDYYLGFQDGEWTDEDGGYTTYLDTEDELLTLVPSRNTLTLVQRDAGSMRYVKYIISSAPGPRFDYTNTLIFSSRDDDDADDYVDDNEDGDYSEGDGSDFDDVAEEDQNSSEFY